MENIAARGAAPDDRLLPLLFGLLGPPVVWAARFGAAYLLVPYACWWDWLPVLHLVTGVALIITAGAGVTAWAAWRRVGKGGGIDRDGGAARTRFLAIAGLFSSAFFFLVIVAEAIANFMIDPCWTATTPVG